MLRRIASKDDVPAGAAPLRIATLLISTLMIVSPVIADDWQRHENSNFIAFSNGSASEVHDVLNELELVRAAASQTPGFFIPDKQPKTLVLLPATMAEFSRLVPFDTMAGFAQPLDDHSVIVLPLSGGYADFRVVARHEFAHTMLFNDWFDYPHWYAEGFAEVVSSIEVDRRRNQFTIGEQPDRYGRKIRPRIDWDELVSTDFDAHNLEDPKLIQVAYSQNWLLFHYLTLNEKKDYSSELDRYFALVTSGDRTELAFATAFGSTVSNLWDDALQRYARRPPSTRQDFDPVELDLHFNSTPAGDEILQPLLTYLADKADARRQDRDGLPSLDRIVGEWDQLKFKDQCSDPLIFALRPDGNIVAIEGFYSAPESAPIPALFDYERLGPDSFQLTNVTAESFPNVVITSDYRISMRTEDVFCLDELPANRLCSAIFHRCAR